MEKKDDTRLIERWLPIAEIGGESVRERGALSALPPTYYLHVWWARRPLVASRAAILASLLPADADREKFTHVLGIHGDGLASKRKILQSRRTGIRFEGDAYTYDRAYSYCLSAEDREWLREATNRPDLSRITILDPTAGGGSIPFEAIRLGVAGYGNDLNPVAALIERATVEWPVRFGSALTEAFRPLADKFVLMREERLKSFFPEEPEPDAIPTNYV